MFQSSDDWTIYKYYVQLDIYIIVIWALKMWSPELLMHEARLFTFTVLEKMGVIVRFCLACHRFAL